MKKLLSFLLAVIISLSFAGTAFAAENGTISVAQVNAKAGDTVEIPVTMSNNPGIVSIRFSIEYDSSVLQLTGVTDGGLMGTNTAVFGNNLNLNPYTVLWEDSLSTTNHTSNGTLVTFTFKVLENASEGNYPIEITLDQGSTFDADINDVSFNVVDGFINIPSTTSSNSTITIQSVQAVAGSQVEVPIVVSDNPGLVALRLSVSYDTTKLRLLSVEDKGLLGVGTNLFGKDLTANPYTMLWEDSLSSNYTENGELVVLTFEVLETASAGDTPITVFLDEGSTFDEDLNDVFFDIINGVVGITSASGSDSTITVQSAQATIGSQVKVPIVVAGNPGLVALRLSVNYDTTKLKLLSVEDKGLLGVGTNLFGKDLTANPYTMLWEDSLSSNYTANGELVVLTFEVLQTASAGHTPITVSLDEGSTFDEDLNDVFFEMINGVVTIGGDVVGDIITGIGNTVVDNKNYMIWGLKSGIQSLDEYVSVKDGYTTQHVLTENGFGSGTVLNVIRNGSVFSQYTIVVFGDVNGDGWYDGQDAVIVACLANGMLTKYDVSEAVYMAADCNHDGVIDEADIALLNEAGALLASVDQSKSSEELLETSSAYVEYISLIDQTIDVEDETPTEPEVEETPSDEDLYNKILAFLQEVINKIIAFITNLLIIQ